MKRKSPPEDYEVEIPIDENDSIPYFTIPDTTLVFPEIFEGSFLKGCSVKQWGLHMKFYTKNIGLIKIPSGKIIAEDPVTLSETSKPYTNEFPIGTFPVEIAKMIKYKKYEGNAFVRIRFSENKIARWEYALVEGQKPIPITNLKGYGYSVDGGIGLFIDQEGVKEFTKILHTAWDNLFLDNFEEEYLMYAFGQHNVATFTTGAGDGFYRTYVGYDKENSICQLLTDFELVEWWE